MVRHNTLLAQQRRRLVSMVTGRYGLPLALGLVAGLALNLATMPFLERGCQTQELEEGAHSPPLPGGGMGGADGEGYVGGQQDESYEPRLVTRDPDEVAQKVSS